jgi:hypothetical protein
MSSLHYIVYLEWFSFCQFFFVCSPGPKKLCFISQPSSYLSKTFKNTKISSQFHFKRIWTSYQSPVNLIVKKIRKSLSLILKFSWWNSFSVLIFQLVVSYLINQRYYRMLISYYKLQAEWPFSKQFVSSYLGQCGLLEGISFYHRLYMVWIFRSKYWISYRISIFVVTGVSIGLYEETDSNVIKY